MPTDIEIYMAHHPFARPVASTFVVPGFESDILEFSALENIPAFSVVISSGRRADSNNTAHFAKVIGVTLADVLTGNIGFAVAEGEITDTSWVWSPNVPIYLNGVNMSHIPPSTGFNQRIAVSRMVDVIYVQIGPPVLL